MNRRLSCLAIALVAAVPFHARATLGPFEHGTGIKGLAFGGVSYIGTDESTAISANPALAIGLGSRFDVGSNLLIVEGGTRITGNAAGPDDFYPSNGKRLFPIPQFGVTVPLAPRWAFGASAFAAGLGPDYPRSPYARFAQTPEVAARSATALNSLKIAGISLVLAHEIVKGHSIGLSANVQNQSLSTEGTAPFAALSEAPEFIGNQGQHSAFGTSFTLGWTGTLTPWLSGALSYRSKTWTQRIEQYRGLLPDQGRLELPVIFGGALQLTPAKDWRIAVEYQHFAYGDSHGFGNRIDLVFQGRPLGSTNGPGFGWSDQNVYKLGVSHRIIPSLNLIAGFSYATQVIPRSQTLFSGLAPATPKLHFTGGFTYALNAVSEITGYATSTDRNIRHGQNSIPAALGGGEADVRFRGISAGLSYGRRFGATR